MNRQLKQSLLKMAAGVGGFALTRSWSRKALRILAYHGLWITPGYQYGDRLFISPEQFERRMVWLKNSNYPVLALGEAVERMADGSLPDYAVVITIDDGWAATFSHMLPILERLNLPATVYVTTWYSEHQLPVVNVAVDYLLKRAGRFEIDGASATAEIVRFRSLKDREDALKRFAATLGVTVNDWWDTRQFHLMDHHEIRAGWQRGFDIQLHTHRHRSVERNVAELEQEIADNRAALAAACGVAKTDFVHFCYPSGGYSLSADSILSAAGIRSGTLSEEGLNFPGTNLYQLRRFLDGRSVSHTAFEAYLCGALEFYEFVLRRHDASRARGRR